MSLDALDATEVIEVMENFIERRRPPEEIRPKLDLGYRIEDQSVIIHEIRPRWDKPDEFMLSDVAKATFVKHKNLWKIYWQRASLKWQSYEPRPTVKTLQQFTDIVDEDKHHCFWG